MNGILKKKTGKYVACRLHLKKNGGIAEIYSVDAMSGREICAGDVTRLSDAVTQDRE